jgi:hypothetical protein
MCFSHFPDLLLFSILCLDPTNLEINEVLRGATHLTHERCFSKRAQGSGNFLLKKPFCVIGSLPLPVRPLRSRYTVTGVSNKIASCTLSWTTGEELFNGFKEVLIDTALTNWEDLVAPIADADKDPPHFEQTLQAMYTVTTLVLKHAIFILNISAHFRNQ